jgi:hypothetical protein
MAPRIALVESFFDKVSNGIIECENLGCYLKITKNH